MAKAKTPLALPFTRSELILLYTVLTSRIAMLALNPDMPEDAAYRAELVRLSLRIENMVKDMDTPKEKTHG